MFEETIEYLHFAPDLRLLPLWAALQSSFWIKIEFWVITLSQALACTWFLLHRVLVPPNGFHKNQKKVCASDGHGRYDKNSDFCGFGPWFLDNNKHKKVKICFFLYNSTHTFRKWKKKCFNTVLDTYIHFQSSNFTFHPKKGQNSGPNIFGTSWDFGEKIYQVPNVIIQYKIIKNKENLKTSLPSLTLFCLDFSENGS